jgi:hypothetical protein
MTNAASAVEAAAFAALSAGVSGAPVFQHVPEGTPNPVVVIGSIELKRMGTKDASRDRQGLVTIGYLTEGEERRPLHALQEQVEAALDGLVAEHDGYTIEFSYEDDGDARDETNEQLYAGMSRFAVLAFYEETELGPELIVAGDTMDEEHWNYAQNGFWTGSTAMLTNNGVICSQSIPALEDGGTYRIMTAVPNYGSGNLFVRFYGDEVVTGPAFTGDSTFDMVAPYGPLGLSVFAADAESPSEFKVISCRRVLSEPLLLRSLETELGGTNLGKSEVTPVGTVITWLKNRSSGSTISLVDDAGGIFALNENELLVLAAPLDYETATSHSFTIRETKDGFANSPRDTVFTLIVGNDPIS